MSDSSLKDEDTQLAPLPLEKMPGEERKKANHDRKGKAEDRVEVLTGSFMKIISVALNRDEEMESDIG